MPTKKIYKAGETMCLRKSRHSLTCHRLDLGVEYVVGHLRCRFIKTTPCGYNFLNLAKSKCLFSRQLYPIKQKQPIKKNSPIYFFIPSGMMLFPIGGSDETVVR